MLRHILRTGAALLGGVVLCVVVAGVMLALSPVLIAIGVVGTVAIVCRDVRAQRAQTRAIREATAGVRAELSDMAAHLDAAADAQEAQRAAQMAEWQTVRAGVADEGAAAVLGRQHGVAGHIERHGPVLSAVLHIDAANDREAWRRVAGTREAA